MGATAVTACFASPLLTHLIGLGISFAIHAVKNYPESYELHVDLPILETGWVVLLICLSLSVIVISTTKTPPKTYGIFLIVSYVLFLIVTLSVMLH